MRRRIANVPSVAPVATQLPALPARSHHVTWNGAPVVTRPAPARRGIGATLTLALLLALLISPTAAHAAVTGSIVFIKDHNVWIMPADSPGAARALTTDGSVSYPYSSPAMDDSGTVYAVASLGSGIAGSGDIVRFDTSGNVLGSFRPITIGTIYALSVSPDGQTVGFTWAQSSSSPIGGGSVFGVAAFAGFAHADGSSSSLPTDLQGYQPSFSSNSTAVLSAYATHYSQAGLRTYQLGQAATQSWLLTCQELLGVCVFPASPDISPQGERVVATGNDPNGTSFGFGTQKRLVVWEMAGAPRGADARLRVLGGCQRNGTAGYQNCLNASDVGLLLPRAIHLAVGIGEDSLQLLAEEWARLQVAW